MENEQENKLTKELAESEFEIMCDTMGAESDVDIMDDEEVATFNSHKRRIVKAIMTGHVSIDDGVPTVHCKNGDKVTYVEPSGGTFLVPSGKKETEVHRLYAMIAGMTKGKAKVQTRPMPDVRLFTSLSTLFISM